MSRPEGSPETKAIFEQWKSTIGGIFDVQWGSWHTDIATAFAEYYHKKAAANEEED